MVMVRKKSLKSHRAHTGKASDCSRQHQGDRTVSTCAACLLPPILNSCYTLPRAAWSPEKVSNCPSDPQHDSLLDPLANPKTTKHIPQRSFVKHALFLPLFTSKIMREEAVSSRMQIYTYKKFLKVKLTPHCG